MKTIALKTWEDFELEISDLQTKYDDLQREQIQKKSILKVAEPLYRGHADATWPLSTTLERAYGNTTRLADYFSLISNVKPEIETFTSVNFDELPSRQEYLESLKNFDASALIKRSPAYNYMSYLRHYGFPSPLLDWTKSPFIAAFFAFKEISNKAKKVAVYVLVDSLGIKQVNMFSPNIVPILDDATGNKRHFSQQCKYTICVQLIDQVPYYVNHEEVLSGKNKSQDILYKFTLPTTERLVALRKLDSYNINSFSLFGSTEALMDTTFLRRIYLPTEHLKAFHNGQKRIK